MQLPFTHEQFLDVFAAYHRLFWPVAALLWIVTLGVLLRFRRDGPRASPIVAALLAAHWAWSSAAYHLALFRSINPAATAFAVLFLAQAVLFSWRGVVRRRLVFIPSRSGWGAVAIALVAYAMVYPVLGLLSGLSYPRMPTFGVPCPTTILTAGLLLMLPRMEARLAAAIPVLWTAIGGSAAFVLAIRADLALLLAGPLVLFYVLQPGSRSTVRVRG